MKDKKSVVISLIYRIFNACSTWKLFHASMEKARKILHDNCYPQNFVESIIFDTLTKLLNEKRRDNKKTQEVLDDVQNTIPGA